MAKHPGGRPNEYTQEVADRICEELAIGKSLRSVCLSEDMPAIRTIFNWFRSHPEFLLQYEKAKQESADAMSEEVLEIADNENMEDVQRARLRVDTRKWLMAKMKPKKYGDKMDVTTDGKPLNVTFDNSFANGLGN